MRGLAVLAAMVSLLLTACAAADADDIFGHFQHACLDSDGDRAAFAAYGAARGWESMGLLAGTEHDPGPDWGLGFVADWGRLMMAAYDGSRERPIGLDEHGRPRTGYVAEQWSCAVDTSPAPPDWRDRMDRLIVDGEPLTDIPPSRTIHPSASTNGEMLLWGEPMDGRVITIRLDSGSAGLSMEVTHFNHDEDR